MEKWNILSKKRENGIGGLFVAEKKAFSFLSKTNNGKGLKTFEILILVVASIYLQCWGEEYAPNNSCLFPIASVQFITVVVVLCRILQCPVL